MNRKSFSQSFLWVGMFLLAMGLLFLGIATVIQLLPIRPENINMYHNGVRQRPSAEAVDSFKLMFLGAFGIPGFCMAFAGVVFARRAKAQKEREARLKQEGACIMAEVADCTPTIVRVNGRNLINLHCKHVGEDGEAYVFKSGYLRENPVPYLQDYVLVYHDKDNIKSYFVDVDGSVATGGG